MTQKAKAIHPIKAGGKVIRPGADLDEAVVGKLRLARLVAKGRAAYPFEVAEVNRADTQTGKPALKLPEKGKAGND